MPELFAGVIVLAVAGIAMLGQVAANVTLVGDQVHISVQSGSEDTASTLRAWAGALQQAMDAAGAPLTTLAINAEASDGAS